MNDNPEITGVWYKSYFERVPHEWAFPCSQLPHPLSSPLCHCQRWQCLSAQPYEVLSLLLKPTFRENFENVSNKAWLASSPREWACTRRRRLNWGLSGISELESYELAARFVTYWLSSVNRLHLFIWAVGAVGPVGPIPFKEVLSHPI